MTKRYIQNCTGGSCDEKKGKSSNKTITRIIFRILLVLFVLVLFYLLFFSMEMRINKVAVSGTSELDSAGIQQKIEESLRGNYLNFVPKNNFLFISQSRLEKNLKNEYRKIRNAKVTKKFPDSVSIEIDERKGLLVWCRNGESCFLLDENGVAYSAADFSAPELVQNHLLQVNDNSGTEVIIGERVIEDPYEKYLLAIGESLKKIGIEIDGKYVTPSRMSEEVQVRTQQGFVLIFSTQFELDHALKTLAIVLKKEIPAGKLGELAYIDLRSENKVFYKFNAPAEPVSTETAPEEKKEEEKK